MSGPSDEAEILLGARGFTLRVFATAGTEPRLRAHLAAAARACLDYLLTEWGTSVEFATSLEPMKGGGEYFGMFTLNLCGKPVPPGLVSAAREAMELRDVVVNVRGSR